jgi:hypothetical protein
MVGTAAMNHTLNIRVQKSADKDKEHRSLSQHVDSYREWWVPGVSWLISVARVWQSSRRRRGRES